MAIFCQQVLSHQIHKYFYHIMYSSSATIYTNGGEKTMDHLISHKPENKHQLKMYTYVK